MSKLTVQTANIQKLLNALSLTTAERDAITPRQGAIIYNSDDQVLEVYDGEGWMLLAGTRTGGGAGGGSGLYSFSDVTFTTGGQTGFSGPSLQQAVSGLTGTGVDSWKNNTQYFNVSNGIQSWIVPKTGTYSIEAFGARGGQGSAQGGSGARMKGDFQLTQGETINIIVGQRGGDSQASGGGGGSYVYRSASDSLPLIVAGGGGGYGASSGQAGIAGQTGTNGTNGTGGNYAGGSNGNGGSTAFNSGWGGAGAGWLTNGGDGGVYGGIAFAPRNGGRGSSGPFNCSGVFGGFGGGGGGGCNGAGGGGGYSGGGTSGGGGGSYNGGSNQSNTTGANYDAGKVTIILLS